MDKSCEDGNGHPSCIAVARKAFKSAADKEINPSELARTLRELFSGCDKASAVELCGELREFLDLDLSDYAYSLAIHDQKALETLDRAIAAWAEKLGREAGP